MSAPHVVNVPASVAYCIIDDRGRTLARVATIEGATQLSRTLPSACAVIGVPSAVVLARVAKGEAVLSEFQARIAARRWARGAAAR